MDAKRIEFLAHDGLRSFETLGIDDAILMAVDCLSAILKDVTDDLSLVAFGVGVEGLVRRKLGVCHDGQVDQSEVQVPPVLKRERHTGDVVISA